jgi:lipoate-protein ligase A
MPAQTFVDDAWRAEADALAPVMLDDEWLHRRVGQSVERKVTIRAGVQVRQKAHKAPGGLIRATVEVQEGIIAGVSLSGDFFLYPAERLADLEAALKGVRVEDAAQAVARFYGEHSVVSPGVTPEDFAQVLA